MDFRLMFGSRSKQPRIVVVRKVKQSKQPALSNAKHGTVLLKGKIKQREGHAL